MAAIGLITVNGKRIIEVDADPSSSGVSAPIGSLALLDDSGTGKLFSKNGAGDTAWIEVGSGGLANVVEDLTPQLGGDLDANGNNIVTIADATADANPTDSISLITGNKTAGTGDSGSLTLQTGTSAGGARGEVSVSALQLNMNSSKIAAVADPSLAQDAATKNYVDTTALLLAGGTMSGAIAMGTNQITGLGDPSLAQDAATKNYVDTTALLLAGGTMSGAIAMGTNQITGLGDPSLAQDAATKNYVDTTALLLAGGTMSGAIAMGTNQITGLGDPSLAQDAATKSYVDSLAAGLDPKKSVAVATTDVLAGTAVADDTAQGSLTTGQRAYDTSALTISWFATEGPTAIDGVTLSNGDRILVKDESATSGPSAGEGRTYNGIYVRTSADVWTRAEDHDGTPANEVSGGNYCFVEQGTANESKGFVLQGNGDLVVDTDIIVFVQFSNANVDVSGLATTSLDNLASVAINTSLVSDTALTDSLGSGAIPWSGAHSGAYVVYSAANNPIGQFTNDAGDASLEGATALNLITSDNGAGNSGSISVSSGTATGTRGAINLSGSSHNIFTDNSSLSISEFDNTGSYEIDILGKDANTTGITDADSIFMRSGSVRNGADNGTTGGYIFIRGGDVRDTGVVGVGGSASFSGGEIRTATGTSGSVTVRSGRVRSDAEGVSNSGIAFFGSGPVEGNNGLSGTATFGSGNTAGSGNSGDAVVQTGDSASGVRGNVVISAQAEVHNLGGTISTPLVQMYNIGEQQALADAETGIVIEQYGLDEGQHVVGSLDIIAVDDVNGDSNVYKRTFHAKRLAGGNVSVILVSSDFTSEEDNSWDVSIVANVGNQSIDVQADGDASNATTWYVNAKVTTNFI